MAGAVFGVYSDKSCSDDTLLTTLPATDTSGFAMSDEFAYTQDTYYLKEIGTPEMVSSEYSSDSIFSRNIVKYWMQMEMILERQSCMYHRS